MAVSAKTQEDPNGAAPAGFKLLEPGSVLAAPNIIVTELTFAKNKRMKKGKLRMSTFNGHPLLEAPRQVADGATQHIWHVHVPLRGWPSVRKVVCVVQQDRVLEVKVDDTCLWATDEWSNGDGTYTLVGTPYELMPDLICPHCHRMYHPGAPMDLDSRARLVAFPPVRPESFMGWTLARPI